MNTTAQNAATDNAAKWNSVAHNAMIAENYAKAARCFVYAKEQLQHAEHAGADVSYEIDEATDNARRAIRARDAA